MERKKLYYFCWPREKKYTGLALDCHMHQREGESQRQLWFHDTNRGHMIPGNVVSESADSFIFCSEGFKPGEWRFTLVTLDSFKEWVHRHVFDGEGLAAKFQTDDELYAWYYEQFGAPSSD